MYMHVDVSKKSCVKLASDKKQNKTLLLLSVKEAFLPSCCICIVISIVCL